MAKTLIETPFPSTAEVARKLGVSVDRVRSVERMVFRKAVRKAAGKAPVKRVKAPSARG